MDRAENQGAGGSVRQQLVQEEGGGRIGMSAVNEGLLRREGMVLQPVEEPGAPGGHHIGLGEMNVSVDKAWRDQVTGEMRNRRIRG